jgi:nitrogen regulatory protein P-II 1
MTTLITAIIRPHALDPVKTALSDVGVTGLTLTEVRGAGRQGGHTETYRGAEYTVDLLPKLKVEVVVASEDAATVVKAISTAARTDRIGDGKIWTTPVDALVRIRTGEVGDDAV